MATKKTTKISDKLSQVNESFSVSMYDNGFMIEVSGRDNLDEWKTTKIVCNDINELVTLIKEATTLPRNE